MPCTWLTIIDYDSRKLHFCRHSDMHVRGNLVHEAICETCNLRDSPCDSPREVPDVNAQDFSEIITKPPSLVKRICGYRKAVKKWTAAGKPVRTDEEVQRIYKEHCSECEHFNTKGSCQICGCRVDKSAGALTNKIRMATENCPLDPPKW